MRNGLVETHRGFQADDSMLCPVQRACRAFLEAHAAVVALDQRWLECDRELSPDMAELAAARDHRDLALRVARSLPARTKAAVRRISIANSPTTGSSGCSASCYKQSNRCTLAHERDAVLAAPFGRMRRTFSECGSCLTWTRSTECSARICISFRIGYSPPLVSHSEAAGADPIPTGPFAVLGYPGRGSVGDSRWKSSGGAQSAECCRRRDRVLCGLRVWVLLLRTIFLLNRGPRRARATGLRDFGGFICGSFLVRRGRAAGALRPPPWCLSREGGHHRGGGLAADGAGGGWARS